MKPITELLIHRYYFRVGADFFIPQEQVMQDFTAGMRFLLSPQEWILLRALCQFSVIDVPLE